jgi:LuxR family maltose regulon positive regulatory protein
VTAAVWGPRQPLQRAPLIQRAHLVRALEAILDGVGRPIALVSAPAGFGKTTLITQFGERLAAGGVHVAWTDLEIAGNSPRAMWRAVRSALTASSPTAAEALTRLPRAERRVDDRFFQRLLDALVGLPDPTVLVLDDVQTLDDPDAMIQLGLFVRRLPSTVRLVLSSRHDPSIALHDMRLAGRLVELRAKDLAFTTSETEQVLSGEGLDADDVAAVTDLTEGWPAGVLLARAVLKRPGDGARLAALFNAQSGVLADYLFNETFTGQTPRSQDLLLRMSVVPVLTDSLAAELTGRPDAGEAIARMVDLAPLLSRYDTGSDQAAYRYHPLLRAYLIGELARRDSDLLRATHRQAALWYERHDDHVHAIGHARASDDTDLLDGFLRRYGTGLIVVGESDALLHVLSESPRAPSAWEAAVGASAAIRCRDATSAARWLTHPHVVPDPSDARLAALRASMTLKLATLTGTTDPFDGPAFERGPLHADDDLELLIAMNHTTALIGAPDDGRLERDLKAALDLAISLGRPAAELQSRVLWAATALGRGDFVETDVRVIAARSRGAELHGADEPSHDFLDVIAAWVAYERLDDTAAQRHLDAWLADPGRATDPSIEAAASRYANLLLEAMHPQPISLGVPKPSALTELSDGLPMALQVRACSLAVRAALGAGRPDRLRQVIDHVSSVLGDCGEVVIMQAMVLAAQRRADLARRLLQSVLDKRIDCRIRASLADALLMATAHALQAGHAYEAFTHLQRALSVAHASGSYRALAQASSEVHLLMTEQADRLGAHREIVDEVLAYVRDPVSDLPQVSPLTARELDILRELPTLNRVDEIAADLLVSTNTVKTHIRGIYRKLGVSSRKEAVTAARRRGIL